MTAAGGELHTEAGEASEPSTEDGSVGRKGPSPESGVRGREMSAGAGSQSEGKAEESDVKGQSAHGEESAEGETRASKTSTEAEVRADRKVVEAPRQPPGRPEEREHLDLMVLRMAQLEPWLPHLHGNRLASVTVIKGEPGSAELLGKPPFFGADGEAMESALAALDWGSNNWCGIAIDLPDRSRLSAPDLRLLIEIIDSRALVALDDTAMTALRESFGAKVLPHALKPGKKIWVLGRALVFVRGFEAALTSDDGGEAKRRVWKELKALRP